MEQQRVSRSKSGVSRRGSVSTEEKEEITVEQSIYLKWIKNQLDGESACLELPFTIMLLLSFSGVALYHLKQDMVLAVEYAIEFDIAENANFAFELAFGNKVIWDVHSYADVWSWVRLGFIPLVMQTSWAYSEGYSDAAASLFPAAPNVVPDDKWGFQAFGPQSRTIPVTGDYLHYNRIIGGLRFRQQVAGMSDGFCKFPSGTTMDVFENWYGKPCMPAWQELPFLPDSMDAEHMAQPERVEWMLSAVMSVDEMIQKAVDMEDGCAQLEAKNRTGINGQPPCLCTWCQQQIPPSPWLREDTQRIEISMATYNAEYGLITLTGVNFFFSRGGEIQKRVEMMSSWMDPFSAPLVELIPMMICDAVWLIMLVYIMTSELKEIINVIRMGDGPHWYHSLRDDYIAFWNVVDWMAIIVAIVVLIFFGLWLAANATMHKAFEALLQAEVNSGAALANIDRESYLRLVEAFYAELEGTMTLERFFRLQLCMYPMMVMMRLFKSFAAQARLAVVTDTLMNAAQDLVHFFIVFFATFFCLCLSSVLFFGQDLEEFATIFRATHTCFRMMFGDWDWSTMDNVRRNISMLWFSGFMLLMVMILLNMLLAIIMENYMKVKKKISDPALAPSLAKQMQEMWRRRQQFKRGERVRLNDIYDAFLALHQGNEKEMLRSTRVLTPSFLLENVRNLQLKQAERTMNNAREEHRKANTKEFELEDLRLKAEDENGMEQASPLDRLEQLTRTVRDGLLYVQDRVAFYDTVIAEKGLAKDTTGAMAQAAAASATANADSAVSDEVLEFVSAEVARLNYETASILGQTVRRVDLRQKHIESRQADMEDSVREMHQTLLNLQSEASSLANKLRRVNHDADKAVSGSAWRRGIASGAIPAIFSNCSPDAEEASMPGMRQ